MFDLLKKKISEFSGKLQEKIGQKKEVSEPIDASGEAAEKEFKKPALKSPETDTDKETDFAVEASETSPKTFELLPNSKKEKNKPPPETKRSLKPKVGLVEHAKGMLTGQLELTEKDLAPLLEQLEFALLEADVTQATAERIAQQIKTHFAGKKIPTHTNIEAFVRTEIKNVLLNTLSISNEINLLDQTRAHQPLVILLLGPNGAGKTTTLAKIANYFLQQHKTVIAAASDTFRAASIEQLEHHAQKLGIRLVKHSYGADPAAVGFDAVAAARANKMDVVLIDSAGRQETNTNLMRELEKIVRVCKPDLKLFLLEGYAGQAALAQVKEFDSKLGIDGVILTKMDTDPKGGNALSVLFELKKPIVFLGTGQGYEDLEAFDLQKMLDKIV